MMASTMMSPMASPLFETMYSTANIPTEDKIQQHSKKANFALPAGFVPYEKLRQKLPDFNFDMTGTDAQAIVDTMVKRMREVKAFSLSASQIGWNFRLFVVDIDGEPPLAVFNARITEYFGEQTLREEGSVSVPGLRIKIKRPEGIRIRMTNQHNQTVAKQVTGVTARVFQHEYDHMEGILFTSRASIFHRDQAYRRLKTAIRRAE